MLFPDWSPALGNYDAEADSYNHRVISKGWSSWNTACFFVYLFSFSSYRSKLWSWSLPHCRQYFSPYWVAWPVQPNLKWRACWLMPNVFLFLLLFLQLSPSFTPTSVIRKMYESKEKSKEDPASGKAVPCDNKEDIQKTSEGNIELLKLYCLRICARENGCECDQPYLRWFSPGPLAQTLTTPDQFCVPFI